MWEGGIRVPAIWKWPDKIPANTTVKSTATCMDIFPSLTDLVNQTIAEGVIDGKSLWDVLLNGSTQSPHELVYHYNDVSKPLAVTVGQYKVHFYSKTGTKFSYLSY